MRFDTSQQILLNGPPTDGVCFCFIFTFILFTGRFSNPQRQRGFHLSAQITKQSIALAALGTAIDEARLANRSGIWHFAKLLAPPLAP